MNYNPDTTAVIVVDMQNDFAAEDGALYAPPSGSAIEPILSLLANANENGVTTVYTRDVHPSDQFEDTNYYDEFERWGEHVVEGTEGAEIVDELPEPDYVVDKNTYDAFHETNLDDWLTEQGIETVLVCGTLANVCVLHTASSAGLRDYRPVVIEDAVGYIEESDKEYAVEHAEWLFGELDTVESVTFE